MRSIVTTDLLELRRADRANMTATEWYSFLKTTDAPVDELQQAKIAQLNEACEQAILAGFASATMGHTYNYSSYDQLNLTQQMLVAINDTNLDTIDWKTVDAGLVTHSRDKFLAVCQEADEHKRSKLATYRELKVQVAEASSKEQLDNIAWPA
jgi:hypothetical protein